MAPFAFPDGPGKRVRDRWDGPLGMTLFLFPDGPGIGVRDRWDGP